MVATGAGGISQSPYFSESFDCAVFDGPLRVYFNKDHEEEGLKIYYRLKERMGLQTHARLRGQPTLFVMVYMTLETYLAAGAPAESVAHFFLRSLGSDWVMGVNGVALGNRYETLCAGLPAVYQQAAKSEFHHELSL